MKLYPLLTKTRPFTTPKIIVSEPINIKTLNYNESKSRMREAMEPIRDFLRELNPNKNDEALYELVLEANARRYLHRLKHEIACSRFLVTKGNLPVPKIFLVTSRKPGTIQFAWKYTSGLRNRSGKDELFIAIYHPDSGRWVFEFSTAQRADCKYDMKLYSMEGETVHIYAGFVSRKNKMVSTSVYLGIQLIQDIEMGMRA